MRFYSRNAVRESKDGQSVGIAAIIRAPEKTIVVIGDDFCVSQHRWNRFGIFVITSISVHSPTQMRIIYILCDVFVSATKCRLSPRECQ